MSYMGEVVIGGQVGPVFLQEIGGVGHSSDTLQSTSNSNVNYTEILV